ncbi:MAG: sugar kinase [Candidatus Hodarchaeales archaeon]|jgi:NAD kinase
MTDFGKIVIIIQKTWLDELIERFNTKEQAKFYLEHQGINFTDYQLDHNAYYTSLHQLKRYLHSNQKFQIINKSFLPNFLFNTDDLIVVLGRDGLVVNTAKYLDGQPILALNPDKKRIEGILLPFDVSDFKEQLNIIKGNEESTQQITLAGAQLNTTQTLIGVNDLFIGHHSHQSARYIIRHKGSEERHSSSGIIISTGLGSTGWYKSIITGALGIANHFQSSKENLLTDNDFITSWDVDYLRFCVREPWVSKISGSNVIYGQIDKNNVLEVESQMPEQGVIFSDGVESDYLSFNSGTIARIGIAEKKVNIIVRA